MPSDKEIEKALQAETRVLSATEEDVTVNKVRNGVIEKLGLEEDFFKVTADWKTRSRDIIVKAMVSIIPILFR